MSTGRPHRFSMQNQRQVDAPPRLGKKATTVHVSRSSPSQRQAAFLLKGGEDVKRNPAIPVQLDLFSAPAQDYECKFISNYRVALVHDQYVPFERCQLSNSHQCHPIIRNLIETHGQSDREQFCVVLLNAKNEIIGLNIVATGTVTSAQIHPREVLKPAILANSSCLILCHNHPTGNVSPSAEDIALTKKIVHAAQIIGIQVHEHLIVSIFDDKYFSFADNGMIKEAYDAIG